MTKTGPFFKLATSALVDKQRNATLGYDPRYPQKAELRKPPVNSIRCYCSKALGSPCLKGCLCNLSNESNVQY